MESTARGIEGFSKSVVGALQSTFAKPADSPAPNARHLGQ